MNKILEQFNSDLELAKNINISKYTENVDINHKSQNNYFDNMAYCIIENNDLEAKTYDGDIKMYFQKKIIDICTDITPELLSTYNFSKSLKSLKFQQGLQLSATNKNMLSTLIFLREYYKTNFIIVHNNIAYDDTIKSYNKIYILFQNDKFRILDNIDNIKIKHDICDLLEKDIKGNIYNTILKSITSYKLPELVDLAKQHNISSNGKKKELYDRIYKELVNRL